MTAEEKQQLTQSIHKEIQTLKNEMTSMQELLQPIKKDCTLDMPAHQGLQQEQDINIKRYEESKRRLEQLQKTLLTIDTEEYGVCKECEENINIQRLKIIPESQYCVSCMNELKL